MENLYIVISLVCAACISFTMTPIARVLAFKIGAVDVPKDSRRMHQVTMPLLGGFAIYAAFFITVLAFFDFKNETREIMGIITGATMIVLTGILDDKFNMNPIIKLCFQIAAATLVAFSGVTIDSIGGMWIEEFAKYHINIPVTVIWIVAVTNAVNLIDGLDGLSCGVSTISALSILISSFFMPYVGFLPKLLTAILAGSCLGFLPYNFNPAKIFMGDTGSMFLGFALSSISVLGAFKTDAFIAFWVPLIAFAVPLFDTTFAFIRRILQGKSPFTADRGHIHHKLIDMGFNQRQSVTILYAISAIFGIASILWAINRPIGGIVIIFSALIILFINWRFITKNDTTRDETGLGLSKLNAEHETSQSDETATITRTDVAEAEKNSQNNQK